MRIQRIIAGLAIVIAGSLAALQAGAADPRGGMEGGPGMPGLRGGRGPMRHPGGRLGLGADMQGLDLTDAQREKLRDIRDQGARRQIELRAKIATARLDLRKLMRADKPDVAAINAQIDRLAQWRAGAQKARVASMLEGRAVLTPDQRQMLRERPRMGGRIRPGAGHGPGPGAPGDGE